jgi:Tol biopolymer transport system component
MGQRWLASLASKNGRERVELVDLSSGTPVPLNGINQADSQTISLSVSGDGQRIALVRQREERTELMLYRRNVNALQKLPINPPGIPRSVSLNGNGRLLAVQVSRRGRWDVDLIRLP